MKTNTIFYIIAAASMLALSATPATAIAATNTNVSKQKPIVAILATGGTIAGSSHEATDASYEPGVLSVQQIISSVPEIEEIAQIKAIQVCNISSQNMEQDIWLRLWHIADSLFTNNLCDGIVITHGTDTMEETAYFLNLTIRHPNPVVVTGAMRPATALGADGPANLFNAVALASSPEAHDKGVMVVMNDNIFCANDVTKSHTTNTNAFSAPNLGPLGQIRSGNPVFQRDNKFIHTSHSEFDISALSTLPQTEIVYAYAFASDMPLRALIRNGAEGIVIAGVGHGNYNRPFAAAMQEAYDKGVRIVRSTRIPAGGVDESAEEFNEKIPVSLQKSPQKARILLMLALTKTKDPLEIAYIFKNY
jgi:L-asparaginase